MSKHFLNIPAIYRLGTKWIGRIPKPLSYALSRGIAAASYGTYKTAVANVKANLARALPGAPDRELSRLARRLFMNYSTYLVDYGRYTSLGREDVLGKIASYDGKENLEAAIAMNRGIILLTAHLGNWELGGIFFGRYGLKTNVVTLEDGNAEIDEARRWYRERHNVNTITIGNSPFATLELVKALGNGEMVAMLIDRYQEGLDALETEFFGRPALFPRGPFILSRLTGAPLIAAFVVKEEDGYKGIIERPLVVREEAEEAATLKEIVKILERCIIMYPDQWYNFTRI